MALYWVGGTGNWSDATNHWATTSGGAPGAGNLPTATDDVFFDSASNATGYTVTIDATANCLDFTMAGPLVGAVTWAGSSALNIYGSMNLSGGTSGITRTYTGVISFSSTSTGKTITTNSVVPTTNNVQFNGTGGGWTLQDAFTLSGNNTISHTAGTLDTNGVTVTGSSFSSTGATTRTLTLGASAINLSGSGTWSISGSNQTFNANTSTITVNSSSTAPFTPGSKTYYNVNINKASQTTNTEIQNAGTYNDLTISSGASKTITLTIYANQTINGTLTINGNSSINRIQLKSDTKGTARTLTAATISVTNADFQDITGAGAGSWNLSAITGLSGDCGGNSGITFTTPVTTDCSAGTTWSTATWSSRVPLPQDTATFSGSSRTITQDMPRIGSVNFAGSSGLTWTTSTTCSVFGSINLTDLATLTASTQAYTFEGRGTMTITCAGKQWDKIFTINTTGTFQFGDTFSNVRSITLSLGNFNANNQNSSFSAFASSASTTRSITLGSGTMSLTNASGGSNWNVTNTTGLTFNANSSTIKYPNTDNNNDIFQGSGLTYNNVWFDRGTSTGTITIVGSNTFADFKDTGTVAHSLLFTTGTSQTVTSFTVNGTAGNLITINSTTTATHALVKSGGGTISCDYLNIQHSVATPSSTWYAGTNSTDNQAVATAGSGWTFTALPGGISTGGLLMFF